MGIDFSGMNYETNMIENVEKYNPAEVPNNVLNDDWRIVVAWYANIKQGKKMPYTEETIFNLAKKIFEELLIRDIVNFTPENEYYKELLIRILEKRVKKGIYLVPPHGEMIWNGKKEAIVKKEKYDIKGFYLLASGDKAYGYIRLKEPERINLEKFKELRTKHQISEEERKDWWPDTNWLYYYEIRDFVPFDKPRGIRLPQGIQNFFNLSIQDIYEKPIEYMTNVELIRYHAYLHYLWTQKPKDITPENLINTHLLVIQEMKKRGLEHRPRTEFDEVTEDWSKYGEKIPLEGLLNKFTSFSLAKPYISLIGSIVVEGSGNDIDLLVKDRPDKNLEFRIRCMFPPSWHNKIHFVYDMHGAITNYIPIYEKRIERIKPELITMSLQRVEAVANEAEASKKEDKIVPFRFFLPLKAVAGYRENEIYSIEGLIETVNPKNYPYCVDMKYDGARAILTKVKDKVKIQSEDGGIWTERFPSIVEQMKQLSCESVVFDCEITGHSEEQPHWGRSEVAGYAHAIEQKVDDRPFVANIFTILYLDGQDLHKKTEIDRKRILDSFKEEAKKKNLNKLNIVEWKLAKNSEELKQAVEYFRKLPFSEGAMIKAANAEYSLSGRTGFWYKFKNERDMDAEVVEIHRVKGTDAYNYLCVIRDAEGKIYPVGRTYNTKIKVPIGGIIRVAFVNINKYTDQENGRVWYNWWAPRPIEYREDMTTTSTPDFVDKLVEETGGEVGEKEFPKRYLKFLKEEFEEEDLGIKKMPELPKEVEREIEKWNSLTHKELKEIELEKLPKNFFVMEMHARGKTLHYDFRTKINSKLEGFTLAVQKPNVFEDINDIEDIKRYAEEYDNEKYFKFYPSMKGETHVFALPKANQPLEWIREVEDVNPPGSVGATRFEEGVFWGLDCGLLWRGAQKPYFKEYFLYGRKFRRRLIFRQLPTGEFEKVGREIFHWEAWLADDPLPYLLSKRGREKRDYVPPEGESGLSPEWEAVIPKNLAWWQHPNLTKTEKLKLMDMAYNWLIEQEYLTGKPIELEKQYPFVLQRRWWKGQVVIRNMPFIFYDLRFEKDGDIFTIRLLESPFFVESQTAMIEETDYPPPKHKNIKDWLEFEGEIPPLFETENPNKKISAYVEIIDSGKLEIIEQTDTFIHLKIEGEKINGKFVMKREDPNSEIWVWERSKNIGEVL